MMEIELAIKFGSLVIAGITCAKLMYDWLLGRHGRLREEYRFAKELLRDIESEEGLHPYAKQKGYQALAGDVSLSVSEIEYLLQLQDSARSLKDYVLGRKYLEHFSTAADVKIDFRKCYRHRWSRIWRQIWYFFLYLGCFSTAVGPLWYFAAEKVGITTRMLPSLAITIPVFLPMAMIALRAGVRVARAEALVKKQKLSGRSVVVSKGDSTVAAFSAASLGDQNRRA
jgi:hypothetical protein